MIHRSNCIHIRYNFHVTVGVLQDSRVPRAADTWFCAQIAIITARIVVSISAGALAAITTIVVTIFVVVVGVAPTVPYPAKSPVSAVRVECSWVNTFRVWVTTKVLLEME